MLKTGLLFISLILNIFLLYIVIDQSVSVTYMGTSIENKEKPLMGCKHILNRFKDKIEINTLTKLAKEKNLDMFEKIENTNELIINGIIFQFSKENNKINSIDIFSTYN